MRRECRECFPRNRGLAMPTCMRDARAVMHTGVAVYLGVEGGENVPGIPAHAQPAILRIW